MAAGNTEWVLNWSGLSSKNLPTNNKQQKSKMKRKIRGKNKRRNIDKTYGRYENTNTGQGEKDK